MTTNREDRVVQVSKKKFFGTIIVLIIIAVVVMGSQGNGYSYGFFYNFERFMDNVGGIGLILAVLWLIWGLFTYITDSPSDPEKNKRLGQKRIGSGAILFLIISLLWVLAQYTGRSYYGISSMQNVSAPSVGEYGGSGTTMVPPEYRDQYGQKDITDTREFLKTSYSADIKTADVRTMERNVKSIVREEDGRVDSEQVSDRSAYLRFVVPQTKFESFRTKVAALTYAKLYVENISSENLLGQKQNIEGQTASQATYLADLQAQKKTLDSTHATKSAGYKKELADIVSQLATARVKINSAQTSDERTLYQIQETTLMARESSIRSSITAENKSYGTTSAELASKIANSNSYLSNLSQQDTDLLNNVATVSGSVSIEYADWWALAVLLSPIHPGWLVLILVLVVWYILRRTHVLPRIEFV